MIYSFHKIEYNSFFLENKKELILNKSKFLNKELKIALYNSENSYLNLIVSNKDKELFECSCLDTRDLNWLLKNELINIIQYNESIELINQNLVIDYIKEHFNDNLYNFENVYNENNFSMLLLSYLCQMDTTYNFSMDTYYTDIDYILYLIDINKIFTDIKEKKALKNILEYKYYLIRYDNNINKYIILENSDNKKYITKEYSKYIKEYQVEN